MGLNHFNYIVVRAAFLFADCFLRMILPPVVQLLLFKISVVLKYQILLMISILDVFPVCQCIYPFLVVYINIFMSEMVNGRI